MKVSDQLQALAILTPVKEGLAREMSQLLQWTATWSLTVQPVKKDSVASMHSRNKKCMQLF
jgi:hypothetical protein